MLSKNEWDPLQSVIVGIADDAKIPKLDTSLRCVNYADIQSTIQVGNYPQQVIDEANEDLTGLVKFLEGESVTVYRPDNKVVPEYYNYCPRDTVLVHDDLILTTPNPLRARQTEHLAMLDTLKEHGRVITKLHSGHEDLYNKNCLGKITKEETKEKLRTSVKNYYNDIKVLVQDKEEKTKKDL